MAGGRAKFSIAAGAVILLASSARASGDELDDVGVLFAADVAPTVSLGLDSFIRPRADTLFGGRLMVRGGPLVTKNLAVTLGLAVDIFSYASCGVDSGCIAVPARTYTLRLDAQYFFSRRWWLRGGLGFSWFRPDGEFGDEGGSGAWFSTAIGVDALRHRHIALTVAFELAELHLIGGNGDFVTAALVFGFVLRTPAARD